MDLKIIKADLPHKPADVGYDASRLDVLDRHLSKLIDEQKIQCASYMMVRSGKPFALRSVGTLTYDGSEDMLPDSIFRIASMTKMFTSVAIMTLCEEGAIYLTQKVCEIIKEFDTQEHKNIMIKHLLTHTSGICPDGGIYFGEQPYQIGFWELLEKRCNDYNWIEAVLAVPKRAPEGVEWSYSSMGFAILGEIIKRVSGMSAEEYIINNIVKPLGMSDTFFDIPAEKVGRVCYTDSWGKESVIESSSDHKEEDSPFSSIPKTGGGLYSTVSDMSILANMFLGKGTFNGVRILGRKTVEKMASDNNPTGVNFCWGATGKIRPYGLGLDFFKVEEMTFSKGTFSHEGARQSGLFMDPVEEFSIAFFTPTPNAFVPDVLYPVTNIACSGIL